MKKLNLKRFLILLLNTIVIFSAFRIATAYFQSLADAENGAGAVGMICLYAVYTAAVSGLIIAYFVVNQGLSTDVPTPEQLPDEMSAVDKQAFIDDRRRRSAKAKTIVLFIVPFVIVFCYEIFDVFLADYYAGLFTR